MVKRYEMEDVSVYEGPYYQMMENADGDWVKYEDIKHLLAAPEGDARWQTMETAPKDGTHVLVLHGGTVSEAWWAPHGFRSEVCWGGKGWSYAEWSQPTHWHPMPPLPSDVRALPQRVHTKEKS